MVAALHAAIAAKNAELDRLRRRAPHGAENFDHSQDLELTYTSNAIEGNTLSAIETTLVIEQGITIGGKPLRDHLEAIDHFEAIRFVRALARQTAPVTEMDVRTLHRLVMLRSMPQSLRRHCERSEAIQSSAPHDRPGACRWAVQLATAQPAAPKTGLLRHFVPRNDGRGNDGMSSDESELPTVGITSRLLPHPVIARNAVTKQSSRTRRPSFNDPVCGTADRIASLRSQ